MPRGVKAKITEFDRGWKKLFERTVKKMREGDPHVRVGVFAEAGSGAETRRDGLTNVEIAAVHEFGAPEAGIPERSFIRSTFRQQRRRYADLLRKLLVPVVKGEMELKQMFDILGAQYVADINKKVRQGNDLKKLQDETIRRKGSSRPLIDTGRMLASVTWVTHVENADSAGRGKRA